MTDVIEMIDPVTGEIIDQQRIAEQLLAQAKEQGVSLVGPGGLLGGLTKTVLETALEAEMTEHLGYEKHGASLGENPGTGRGRRLCSPRLAPSRSTCRGIGTGRSNPRS